MQRYLILLFSLFITVMAKSQRIKSISTGNGNFTFQTVANYRDGVSANNIVIVALDQLDNYTTYTLQARIRPGSNLVNGSSTIPATGAFAVSASNGGNWPPNMTNQSFNSNVVLNTGYAVLATWTENSNNYNGNITLDFNTLGTANGVNNFLTAGNSGGATYNTLIIDLQLFEGTGTSTPKSNSYPVNFTVTLYDVISVSAPASITNINTTISGYTTGTSVTVENQLLISSNRNYNIALRSANANIPGPNSKTIPASDITVSIPDSYTEMGTTVPVVLSSTSQTMANAAIGRIEKYVGFTYLLKGNTAPTQPGTYSTTLYFVVTQN